MKVLVLGGASLDEIVRLPKLPEPKPQTLFAPSYTTIGSTGVGKALALAKLGFDVTLHILVGDDDAGKRIVGELESAGIRLLADPSSHTERHINLIDSFGGRISIFTASVDEAPVLNKTALHAAIREADLFVANIVPYVRALLPDLQAAGKPIWTDLHDYEENNPYYDPFIQASEAIFLSGDRLSDPSSVAKRLLGNDKRFVVVTLGKDGSELFERGRPMTYEPILSHFPFVDPSGAGDSYFAGFLYGVSRGRTLRDAMIDATISGGSAVATTSIVNESLSSTMLEEIRTNDYE
jgi:sugar/nucleoside kinase (ribokinase family)